MSTAAPWLRRMLSRRLRRSRRRPSRQQVGVEQRAVRPPVLCPLTHQYVCQVAATLCTAARLASCQLSVQSVSQALSFSLWHSCDNTTPHSYSLATPQQSRRARAPNAPNNSLLPALPVVTSGLEGVDAFERLKQEAAKASLAHPPKALELPMPKISDPEVAKAALEVTAREGLPVKGTNAKGWEDLRPKIVHDAKPNKVSLS